MNEPTRFQAAPAGFVPAGTQLSGIYEIDAPLAKGGMGEVYRGHAIETGDAVAIKLIRADMADNEAAMAMFRREASALGRLHHEAIVRYFVFSLDPGLRRHYLAMELVLGVSLSDLAARGPLGVNDAFGLMRRVASGLQAAHERGIIHRDISPDNIIVEDGDVTHARIIDFGIARSTRVGDATVIGGGFAGKYNYVSPEQLGLYGGDVTGRSDIYSLGLVIAQCLLGKAIDMGGSQVDIIEKRRRVPDLSGVDPRIRPLLERMLQPDPANRPESMAEIVASKLDESGTPKSRAAAKAPLPRGTKAAAAKPESGGALKWTIVSLFAVAFLGAGGFVGYLTWSDQWSFEKPATGPTGPVPIRVPVDPTPVRPPPVDQNPVRPPPVDLAPVRPPPVDPVRIEPPPNPADPVLRFIRDYDGGDCFLAMPIEVTAKTAEIEAFAQSRKPFDDFDAAFTKRLGWEAMIDGGEVAPGHCAALRFARALRVAAKASPAKLEISKTSLKPGETLEGAFFSDAPEVTLLVVDDSGGFLDVTGKLTGAGPRRAFSLAGISKSPGARLQPMLALAIGSQRRIPSLRPLAATGRAELFATASREIESQGGPVEIAVKFFKLQ